MNALHDVSLGESIEECAATWFARLRSGDLNTRDEAALNVWIAADVQHREALNRLLRSWAAVVEARDDPRIMMLRERAFAQSRKRKVGRVVMAMSACLLLAAAGVGALATWRYMPGEGSLANQTYSTKLGERSTFRLSDGSLVTLNTDTRLRTRAAHGHREVYLERGQAFFRVAKDAEHPFVVHAGGRTVTALGTAFDVRVEAKRFEVTLVEGRVRVEGPTPPVERGSAAEIAPLTSKKTQATEMEAGTQLSAADELQWSLHATDTARATSWLRGYVVFQGAAFEEVVEEMNRYSQRKIVVDDPELAETLISGAFKAGDVDSFVRAYESYEIARVSSEADGAVRLERY